MIIDLDGKVIKLLMILLIVFCVPVQAKFRQLDRKPYPTATPSPTASPSPSGLPEDQDILRNIL